MSFFQNNAGEIVTVCDVCDTELPAQETHEAAEEARRAAGWRQIVDDGHRLHVCPHCYALLIKAGVEDER